MAANNMWEKFKAHCNESDLLTRKGYLVLGGNPTVLDSYRMILWKCGYLVSTDNDGEWRVRKPIPATLSVNKAKRFAYTWNGQPADPEKFEREYLGIFPKPEFDFLTELQSL